MSFFTRILAPSVFFVVRFSISLFPRWLEDAMTLDGGEDMGRREKKKKSHARIPNIWHEFKDKLCASI